MHSLCANPRSVLIGSLVFFLVAAIPLGRAIAESDLLDGSVEQKQTIKALHHKFRRRAALHRVNLAWEPSPSPNIDGYRVYYGTSSGSYTDHIDVGMAMTARLPKPPNGTYFYIVVAYKGSVESSPSNEVESDKAVAGRRRLPPSQIKVLAQLMRQLSPQRQRFDFNADLSGYTWVQESRKLLARVVRTLRRNSCRKLPLVTSATQDRISRASEEET